MVLACCFINEILVACIFLRSSLSVECISIAKWHVQFQETRESKDVVAGWPFCGFCLQNTRPIFTGCMCVSCKSKNCTVYFVLPFCPQNMVNNSSLGIQWCKFWHTAHLGERRGPAEFSRLGARSAGGCKVDSSPKFAAGLTRCGFLRTPDVNITDIGGSCFRLGSARQFIVWAWLCLRPMADSLLLWGNQGSRNGAGAYG